MYGGIHANIWLAPWISDTILGQLATFATYAIWGKTSAIRWARLFAYSFMGPFDYALGLGAQWHYLQVTEGTVVEGSNFIWTAS